MSIRLTTAGQEFKEVELGFRKLEGLSWMMKMLEAGKAISDYLGKGKNIVYDKQREGDGTALVKRIEKGLE